MTGVSFGYGTGTIVTAAQWTALFAQCYPASNVSAYSGTLLSGSTQAAWFTALGLPSAAPGFANGLATLNGSGQLTTAQIPASILGALNYQGAWNASTNSPTLASGVGTKGFYYKVSTIGTTAIDGCSSWAIGDFIVFNGSTWDKIDGQVTQVASTQISDSTASGRALLTGASVLAQRVALNIDQATAVADANQAMTNAMEAVVWTSLTAARTGTLPAASTMNVGQTIYIFDESGNCSQNNTITIGRAGSDTINGGTNYVLNYAYASVALTRVSSTKWTAIAVNTAPTNNPTFRNKVINGDIRIDQRHSGAAWSGIVGGTYTTDRWSYYGATNVYNAQQNLGSVTLPLGFSYYEGFTVGTASAQVSSGVFGVQQAIEGYNFADLGYGMPNAKTVTISFWVYSSITGTHAASLRNYSNSRSYVFTYSITTANTWQYITATIPGDTGGTWVGSTNAGAAVLGFDLGAGSTFQGTAGTWLAGNFVSTSGSVYLAGTLGATFYFTGVQLEVGSVATPFEQRPIDVELALCERYFQMSYDLGTPLGSNTFNGAPTNVVDATQSYGSIQLPFRTRMRAPPSMTLYSPNNGSAGYVFNLSTTTNLPAYIGSIGQTGTVAIVNDVSVAQSNTIMTHYAASAEL